MDSSGRGDVASRGGGVMTPELYQLRQDAINWRLMIQAGRMNDVLTGEQRQDYISELVMMEIALRGSTPTAYVNVARELLNELAEKAGVGSVG